MTPATFQFQFMAFASNIMHECGPGNQMHALPVTAIEKTKVRNTETKGC